jgi:hypothetical protein
MWGIAAMLDDRVASVRWPAADMGRTVPTEPAGMPHLPDMRTS